ncbi:MAG TPA: CotH kinase family protein [Verrucomicrobiae bacterium]|nr:CotH kinase family protein [Verrucomicrobiae bacterium]
MNLKILTALLSACCWIVAADKPPAVTHQPARPKAGEAVRITFNPAEPVAEVALNYQIVDPGKYIARADQQFEKNWTTIPMILRDGAWTAELPAEIQTHRRLVRYRITSGKDKKRLAPASDDEQSNFAYFCYNGVPDWKGAINPTASDRELRTTVTYPAAALEKVPVYHFISHKSSVEKVTWYEPKQWGDRENRNDYNYTGTMVVDDIVYDHVEFRARGGEWRHAMGKNMWKFNFLSGHRLAARDNYGRPYRSKWDKLNLGACIQQGDTGLRGEQGMVEALTYKLFNLAGVEAPLTHWVHLRIIDAPEESPANQYAGDFWGLYLATENLDGHFLREHNLPKGNLYKLDFGRPRTEYIGNPAVTNQSDVIKFISALRRPQPQAWWTQTVDMDRYFSYRSILECVHHYDIQSGKNYFYYLNPSSQKWVVLPWDVDLSWADHVYGSGHEPFLVAGALRPPAFAQQYQDRLAEIRDLLFNEEQINLLIDEHAAIISPPGSTTTIAAADRAKWDYNPLLASQLVHRNKAGQGRFYFGKPKNDFSVMVQYLQQYAGEKMRWVDSNLLNGYQPLPAPAITKTEDGTKFRINSSGNATCAWRLAEISKSKAPGEESKYEIVSIWDKKLPAAEAVEVPANILKSGRIYRLRARIYDGSGHSSRWSKPIELSGPK